MGFHENDHQKHRNRLGNPSRIWSGFRTLKHQESPWQNLGFAQCENASANPLQTQRKLMGFHAK